MATATSTPHPVATEPQAEALSSAKIQQAAITATTAVAPEGSAEPDLVALLTGLPPRVVEQMFKLAEGQVAAETARQQRIESKATSLLTAVGLSLTVASTFGASTLHGDAKSVMHVLALVAFIACLLAGFVSAFLALGALLIRPSPGMNEHAVFSKPILDQVREVAKESAEDGSAPPEALALAQYQMSMTIQLWTMVRGLRLNHGIKSTRVREGQIALLVFLVLVGLLFAFQALSPVKPAGI